MTAHSRIFVLFKHLILPLLLIIGPTKALGIKAPPKEQESSLKSDDSASIFNEARKELLSDNENVRLAAAEKIAGAQPSVLRAYLALLQEPLSESRYPTIALRGMVWAIWGQFPSPVTKEKALFYVRNQKPGPKKKSQIPEAMDPLAKIDSEHDPKKVDWLKELALLDKKEWEKALKDLAQEKKMVLANTRNVAPFAEIRAEMLLRVAVLRALSRFGSEDTFDVARQIFDFGFTHQGVFRDECLRSLGEYAVPELVRIFYTRYSLLDREAKKNGQEVVKDKDREIKVKYAKYQLEELDRQSAKKALSNAKNQEMQIKLLNMYGEVQSRDHVEVVFTYLNHSSTAVRTAARAAWMRYVEGPAPDPTPNRYRKRAGGVVDNHTSPDYLNFRQLAEARVHKFLEESSQVKGTPSLKQMTLQLFAYYDAEREHQMDRFYEKGKQAEKTANWKQATDLYQWILTQEPSYPNRKEMAEAFYERGEELATQGEKKKDQTSISQALGYLHKALLLNPTHPKHARIKARIHFLDGKQSQALGGDGASDFQLAVEADPSYEEAKRELSKAR